MFHFPKWFQWRLSQGKWAKEDFVQINIFHGAVTLSVTVRARGQGQGTEAQQKSEKFLEHLSSSAKLAAATKTAYRKTAELDDIDFKLKSS